MECARAATEGNDLGRAAAVLVDPPHHLVENPRLVAAVPTRPLFDRDTLVGPRRRVVAVDAVDLQPPHVEQARDRADHAVVLEIPCPAVLRREREYGTPPVAVADDGARVAVGVRL